MTEDAITTGAAPTGTVAEQTPVGRRRLVPAPTRTQLVVLIVALLYLAGSVGYVLGSRPVADPSRNSVDVGFLYDMIAHHEQAVALASIELGKGGDNDVSVYAREILTTQAYEMGLMQQQLANWGYAREDPRGTAMAWMEMPVAPEAMPGLASEAEIDILTEAQGADADALFIALMQDHHRGGVHMGEYAASNAKWDFVRDLAAGMVRSQRIEIDELDQARVRDGLSADPPGYEPAQVPSSAPTRQLPSRLPA